MTRAGTVQAVHAAHKNIKMFLMLLQIVEEDGNRNCGDFAEMDKADTKLKK